MICQLKLAELGFELGLQSCKLEGMGTHGSDGSNQAVCPLCASVL